MALRLLGIGLLSVVLAACGTVPPRAHWPVNTLELAQVPFFAQQEYQCGPAALATVLVGSGVRTSPEALVPQVYVPGKQGSFQAELMAAARRAGLLPLILPPEFPAVVESLSAGHPVLVLQNLGVSWWPQWHYAVVVGVDPVRQQVMLRSGTERRKVQSVRSFMNTWGRSRHWAMVVAQPSLVPDWVEMKSWLTAAQELVEAGQTEVGATALEAAAGRWLDQPLPLLVLGNLRYQQGAVTAAADAFHGALLRDPGSVAAANNLASVLIELDCADQADMLLSRIKVPSASGDLERIIEQTRAELEDARQADALPCRWSVPGS